MTLEWRRLGSSDARVPSLGMGLFPLVGGGVPGFVPPADLGESVAIVRHAFDEGITLFDVAPTYGHDNAAERILGEALRGHRDDAFIVSKCGGSYDATRHRDARADKIIASVDGSLRRLRTEHLDLLLVHWPDPLTDPAETMAALASLRTQGKVRFAGVSNTTEEELRAYMSHGELSACSLPYNMLDRRIESDLLPLCDEHDIGILSYGALAHGLLAVEDDVAANFQLVRSVWGENVLGLPLLTDDNIDHNAAVVALIADVARDIGLTLPGLALAWATRGPQPVTALVGPRSADEVDGCVRGAGATLEADTLVAVDTLLAKLRGTRTDVETASEWSIRL